MNPLYNKMVLDGLTLEEAFKFIRKVNRGRNPHSVLVEGVPIIGHRTSEWSSSSFWMEDGNLVIYDEGSMPVHLPLSTKVKVKGESLEVTSADQKTITLTFFYEPVAIDIMQELKKPVRTRRKSHVRQG